MVFCNNIFPFAGDVKVEYNLDKANSILGRNGWKLNKRWSKRKDGKVLTVNILTYNSRPDLKNNNASYVISIKQDGEQKLKTAIVDNIDVEAKKKNLI